jgi:hypothetical protein
MTEPLELSTDELTLGDLEDIETILGCPMEDATAPGLRLRLSCAMIWIRRRKLDPSFTFDDARALPISLIESIAGDIAGTEEPAELPDPTLPRPIAV